MDLFAELAADIAAEAAGGELPDFLLPELLKVAEHPDRYAAQKPLVRQLLEQVKGFDPYAGVGCFGEGWGIDALQATLKELQENS